LVNEALTDSPEYGTALIVYPSRGYSVAALLTDIRVMYTPSFKNYISRSAILLLAELPCLLLASPEARSAAFFLQEQSPAASGRAFAGDAAAAEDVSTIFYNPAGMTELRGGLQGQAGLYLIAPEANISDRGSSVSVGASPATSVGGAVSDQAFNPQPIGNLYLAAPLDGGIWLGLGITVPFGLRDHYQLNYFGRYDSTKTELRTIDIAPSAAYAVTNWLSMGGGIDIQRADAKLENSLPNPLAPGGPSPATDGLFDATGGDWAVGFNLGLLLKPTNDFRVGFSYRSGLDHDLKGNSTTQLPGVLSSAQSVSAAFKLPDIASLGAAYDLSPAITLLAQVDYYGWSRFKDIRLTFADGTQQILQENYKNSAGVSLGAEWKPSTPWVLRGGVEFDQTPTPNDDRSTAVPDSDRTWLAVGASYEIDDRVGVDMSYAHAFATSARISRTTNFSSLATTAVTNGETTDSSDVVGLAVHFRY
jgi:long-chain fatty acid transport protein